MQYVDHKLKQDSCTDVLGCNWSTLGVRRSFRQVCWRVCWVSPSMSWPLELLVLILIANSTASPGGGQESVYLSVMSTLVHHGLIFVPLGYKHAFPQLSNLTEVHGGMLSSTRGCSFIWLITTSFFRIPLGCRNLLRI